MLSIIVVGLLPTAIDLSSKMIEIAKSKADRRKIENIDFDHTTIFDKRYQSGSFDVVFAFYILHLLEDPHKVMERINDLLKPGGLIISVTPCTGEKTSLRILLLLLSKIRLVPKLRSFKISELEALITSGNFKIVETECVHPRSQQYFVVGKKT